MRAIHKIDVFGPNALHQLIIQTLHSLNIWRIIQLYISTCSKGVTYVAYGLRAANQIVDGPVFSVNAIGSYSIVGLHDYDRSPLKQVARCTQTHDDAPSVFRDSLLGILGVS